jgi:hypothetical protein
MDKGEFLILGKRYFATTFVLRLVDKELKELTNLFYRNDLFTFDVDELYSLLEKVRSQIIIFKISGKLVPKTKPVLDNLRLLQHFDKLLNSGFKRSIHRLRQYDILIHKFSLPYGRVDLNDRELITPHFDYIREYLPFDQTVFIQNLILRKIEENKLELASVAFTKLVRRKMPSS